MRSGPGNQGGVERAGPDHGHWAGLDVTEHQWVAAVVTCHGGGDGCTSAGPVVERHRRLRAVVEARFGPAVWAEQDVQHTSRFIRLPVLVVHDLNDQMVPVAQGRRVAAALGTTPLITKGLGHGRILIDDAVGEAIITHLTGNQVRLAA